MPPLPDIKFRDEPNSKSIYIALPVCGQLSIDDHRLSRLTLPHMPGIVILLGAWRLNGAWHLKYRGG
jgi:hypothetical protein